MSVTGKRKSSKDLCLRSPLLTIHDEHTFTISEAGECLDDLIFVWSSISTELLKKQYGIDDSGYATIGGRLVSLTIASRIRT